MDLFTRLQITQLMSERVIYINIYIKKEKPQLRIDKRKIYTNI